MTTTKANTQLSTSQKLVERLLTNLDSLAIDPTLTDESYTAIIAAGYRGGNDVLAAIASQILVECQPITLRGLFYRIVSTGYLPSTSDQHYSRVGRLVTSLRRQGIISYEWVVDSIRSTLKPSSWSGLQDYATTVRDCYRRDYWAHQPHYLHVIAEKDAIAGVLEAVTSEYDVALSPIRGYASESFVWQIASTLRQINKPIHIAYLGDHDPSGYCIEADLLRRLTQLSGRDIDWIRLAITQDDLQRNDVIPLRPKTQDTRYHRFAEQYGDDCAEVDALPPDELRERVRTWITGYIDVAEWERLRTVEQAEQDTFRAALGFLSSPKYRDAIVASRYLGR